MDDIADTDPALAYLEPLLLARNLFGRFFDVTARAGDAFKRRLAARGVAFGDLDGDGLIDAVVNVNDSEAFALRNTTRLAGTGVTVRLRGTRGPRDGIGAKVTVVTPDGVRQTALASHAGSYLSSGGGGAPLHFGLGEASRCESVTVEWPDGRTQKQDCGEGAVVTLEQTAASSARTPPKPR